MIVAGDGRWGGISHNAGSGLDKRAGGLGLVQAYSCVALASVGSRRFCLKAGPHRVVEGVLQVA